MTKSQHSPEGGLYGKYEVTKGGRPLDGECFVLRPDRDPAARVALLAYAAATDDYTLRSDLHSWVQGIQDSVGPDEQAAIMLTVYEGAVADAAHKAAVARRDAESRELLLEDAQRHLAALQAQARS